MPDASFGPKACVFLYLFRVLHILANGFILFRYNLCLKQQGGLGLAGDDDNGPKGIIFFFFFHVFYY